jgi:hypothetical protein
VLFLKRARDNAIFYSHKDKEDYYLLLIIVVILSFSTLMYYECIFIKTCYGTSRKFDVGEM